MAADQAQRARSAGSRAGSTSASTILGIAGIQRWYDPELSTYTAGTWQDLAGNADLTQSVAGSRPTANAAGLNGRASLTFDGSDDHLFNTTPLMAAADACTVIMIAKGASGQIDKRLIAEGSSSTDTPLFVPLRTGSNTRTSSPSTLIRNDAATLLFEDSTGPLVFDDEAHFFGVIIDKTAGTVQQFEDIEFDDPDAFTDAGAFTVDRFALGAMIRTTVQFHWAGEIGPVIIANRALTESEIGQIRGYYVTRGYLTAYQQAQVTSAIPDNYTLAYDSNFPSFASINDLVEDGQSPVPGRPFADSFVTFGVRFLTGNNDRTYKALGTNVGSGSTPLATLLGFEPHELVDGKLVLRFGEIPLANRTDFNDRQHGGGMITTERGYSQGPGFFEARLRVLNNPPGGHLSVWLLTKDTNPHELEIDLVEIIGNNLTSNDKPVNTFFYNGHDEQVGGRDAPQTEEEVSNFTLGEWQTFGFLYETNRFRWYRNGALVRDETAYFDGTSPLYFLVTWESNFDDVDDFPGPADGNNPTFPAEVEIDYLRVYEPPPSTGDSVLLESGDNLLLESGDELLLE